MYLRALYKSDRLHVSTSGSVTVRASPAPCCVQFEHIAAVRVAFAMATRAVLSAFERFQKERIAFVSAVADMAKHSKVRYPRAEHHLVSVYAEEHAYTL